MAENPWSRAFTYVVLPARNCADRRSAIVRGADGEVQPHALTLRLAVVAIVAAPRPGWFKFGPLPTGESQVPHGRPTPDQGGDLRVFLGAAATPGGGEDHRNLLRPDAVRQGEAEDYRRAQRRCRRARRQHREGINPFHVRVRVCEIWNTSGCCARRCKASSRSGNELTSSDSSRVYLVELG